MVCIEKAKCAKLKRSIPYNIQCILSWNTMSIWDCIPVAWHHRSICHAIDSIWKVRSQIVESKNKRIEWKLRKSASQPRLFAEVTSNQWKKASIRNSLKVWKGLSKKKIAWIFQCNSTISPWYFHGTINIVNRLTPSLSSFIIIINYCKIIEMIHTFRF